MDSHGSPQGDRVCQLGHRARVAELHQASQPDCVQAITRQQPQIGIRHAQYRTLAQYVDVAAKGITICCASGDDGSSDDDPSGAHVDFPASSPFVLGVGGTNLVASSGAPPTIQSETVWNELLHSEGATGGGVSDVFTKPSYQNSVNVPPSANPPHDIGRGVPDVAAVADPVTGVVVMDIDGKHLEQIGGTSASTPLWASLIARLNQGLNARCGFLNPLLYGRFSTGVLRDITVGNNGAYSAGPGWDACTGLGSPNGDQLLNALSGAPTQAKSARG